MKALEDYTAKEPRQLSFKKGDMIKLVSKDKENWWMGSLGDHTGLVPSNLVVEIKISLISEGEVYMKRESNEKLSPRNENSLKVNFYLFLYFIFIFIFIFIYF